MALMNTRVDQSKANQLDLEKYDLSNKPQAGEEDAGSEAKQKPLWFRVLNWGVEEGGIAPVPVKARKDTRIVNLFTVWFTMLLCLLP